MVDQIQLPSTQAFSGGADFSQLANLGNVYQAAQEKARQQAALASLGNDPVANAQALIKSGDPSLAAMGMRLQQQAIENARSGSYLDIAKAQAQRQQDEADRIEEARKAAPALYERMFGVGGSQPSVPQPGVRPFPAPLPGVMPQGMPTMPPGVQPPAPVAPQPPIDPANLDARIAQSAQALPGSGAAYPGVTPLPSTASATPSIPIMAADENAGLPAWAGPQSTAAQGTAARMVDTMAAGQPAASAGIDNKTLAAALTNPETKAIATVFAQNKFNPGTWKIEKLDDGRVIAIDEKDPRRFMDVTPQTPGGGLPMSKQEREMQGNYTAALKLFNGDTTKATAYVANGNKLPGENLSVHDSKAVDDNDNIFMSANTAIDNINKLQDLSKKAFQGFGASALGEVTKQFGPGAGTATAEYNNIALRNVVAMVKASFPRPTEYETKLMKMVETGADMPQGQRDDLLSSLKSQLQIRANEAQAKSDAIRNRTYYKPGGGDTTAAAVAAGTAASANTGTAPPPSAKPSLSDFMTKARTANPGVPDGELARYWKDKYGG